MFEIAAGTHQETVLYSFGANSTDGENPTAQLISDAAGNLFGATLNGGAFGYGTLFEISAATHQEIVLYSFGANKAEGTFPTSLISDAQGNLYGTTANGGANGQGTVFELSNTGFVVPETSSLLLAACGLAAFSVPIFKRLKGATK